MKAKRSIVADIVLTVAFLASLLPGVTTVAAHEWLGLVVTAAFLVHIAAHLRPSERTALRTANLVVDGLALVALAVVTVSGVLVSGAVLPAFGFFADGYFFWNPLHAASAKVLLALVIVHLALHARFISGALKASRAHRGDAEERM